MGKIIVAEYQLRITAITKELMNEIGQISHYDLVLNGYEAVLKSQSWPRAAGSHSSANLLYDAEAKRDPIRTKDLGICHRSELKGSKPTPMPKCEFMTADKISHFEKHAIELGVKTVFEKPLSLE